MSWSRPARVGQLLVFLGRPARAASLPRVARDRGAVPRGHPVAKVEGAQERAEQRDLEAGELLGPVLELLGSVLREQELADQVLEGEQDDREQSHRGQAQLRRRRG